MSVNDSYKYHISVQTNKRESCNWCIFYWLAIANYYNVTNRGLQSADGAIGMSVYFEISNFFLWESHDSISLSLTLLREAY